MIALYPTNVSNEPPKESAGLAAAPFRLNDPRQGRIYRRLTLVGPGPASFYRDSCHIMALSPLLDSTTHLVAHLLREIESALRDVLEPVMDRSDEHTGTTQTHGEEIRATLKGLEIPETDAVAQAWLRLAGKNNEYALHARAHRDALGQPRPVDQEFRRFWSEFEAILDVVLERFEARYLTTHTVLDELLAKDAPSKSDARRLRMYAPSNLVAHGYFFGKLKDPAWLEPLRAEGFFTQPPEPEYDYDKGTVRFPLWPAAQYLTRVARLAPQTVLDIALEVPETENIHVPTDIADIALALPAQMAAQLVPRFKAWTPSPYQLSLPERLGAVVEHLAMGGEVDGALELARSLLAEQSLFSGEPRTRIDMWHYDRVMKKCVPPLVATAGERALLLLCDLLEEAIRLSQLRGDPPEDYSETWRPAIEEHVQNRPHDVKSHLASVVRDAAEQIAQADQTQVPMLVGQFECRPWMIFHRIALHLLRKFPNSGLELVEERLTNRGHFDSIGLRREYVLLSKECFGLLSTEDQEKIIEWISKGPDIEQFRTAHKGWTGEPATDEEVNRHVAEWQRDRLAPLRKALPQCWREHLDDLVVKHGERTYPEVLPEGTTRIGPTSPLSSDELALLSSEELFAFLETWRPSSEVMSPSPEGLGQELKTVVAADPEKFASDALAFQTLDPTYVRAFLSGLRDAVKQKRSFIWAAVLDLCRWVVEQPREMGEQDAKDYDRDPHWGWARQEIAHLLSAGFEVDSGGIPFDLRTAAWQVLQPLTRDPNPTSDHEAHYGGSNMDPLTLSLNTVRGEAMHALIRYALWVRRHFENESDSQALLDSGFAAMPEVRSVLEAQLDVERETSLAIRSVYGRWFPWLALIDPAWAKKHTPEIFPLDDTRRELRDAAWETYIAFCPPYDSVVDVLHEEYDRAVGRLGEGDAERERRRLANPSERLAEHLMSLYWRGKLSLDDSDGLLARFFAQAPVAIRAHAVWFLGQSLHGATEAIAPEVIARLQALWTSRSAAVRSAPNPATQSAELVPFGWWFASEKFDETWATDQLKQSLELAGQTEPDHLVVEHLVKAAQRTSLAAVQCLNLIIIGDVEGWHIHGWREEARRILLAALTSNDEEARRAGEALINRLGARGHLDFQSLLSEAAATGRV